MADEGQWTSEMAETDHVPTTAAEIRALDDTTSVLVAVDAWRGAKVRVQSMTGHERAAIMEVAINQENGETDFALFYPEIIIATVYKVETSEKFFEASDREWLASKNSAALEQLARVAMRLSGMDAESRKKAEANFPE